LAGDAAYGPPGVLGGSTTVTGTDVVELTDAQLDRVACSVLNRMTRLGRPVSQRTA